MKKKHLVAIFASVAGGSSAWASYSWPQYAAVIQVALFTSFVFVPLFMFFWSEINRGAFWFSISAAIVVHGLLLYVIRSVFPFSSVLVVVPIALVEASAIFVAIDKILGERSVEHPAATPGFRE
jgi:cellulose synthase/poly-beta-1,6-N-acetylglucosamine synthase-like glycosyltransferase